MDIEFVRTFLAVVATGNFSDAAARMHVTQSTVSVRIRTLEQRLGVALFRRGRGGAELTSAGRRFLRHAKTLVRTFEQARQEVGLPSGYSASLTIRGRIALWEGFLPKWVNWMRNAAPDISLHMEIGFEADIMESLVQGDLDIGLMYTPETRPGLAVERLFDEALVLVTTDPARRWPDPAYVHIDWGPEFHAQFAARFPDMDTSAQAANIGWLGMQLIMQNGGAGYFPVRMVRDPLRQGLLWHIEETPLISLPAYMVFPADRQEKALDMALAGLRELAAQERAQD